MNTFWMLQGRYNGLPIIPIEQVATDFFKHLTVSKLLRKITDGTIALPLVRMEDSQKAAKGISLFDLASYIDERQRQARLELEHFHG
jgi:hypothetical protein